MAANIVPDNHPGIVPGDSVVVTVADPIVGLADDGVLGGKAGRREGGKAVGSAMAMASWTREHNLPPSRPPAFNYLCPKALPCIVCQPSLRGPAHVGPLPQL